jgi:hypothetical protein
MVEQSALLLVQTQQSSQNELWTLQQRPLSGGHAGLSAETLFSNVIVTPKRQIKILPCHASHSPRSRSPGQACTCHAPVLNLCKTYGTCKVLNKFLILQISLLPYNCGVDLHY